MRLSIGLVEGWIGGRLQGGEGLRLDISGEEGGECQRPPAAEEREANIW